MKSNKLTALLESVATSRYEELVNHAEELEAQGIPDLGEVVDFIAQIQNGGIEQWRHNMPNADIEVIGTVLAQCGYSCSLLVKALDRVEHDLQMGEIDHASAENLEGLLFDQGFTERVYSELLNFN